jgi:DNA-binding NarL/FixJ family response regulator
MLDAGVHGLVSKAASGDQLLDALRSTGGAEAAPDPAGLTLTNREAEILELLHTDLTYREIGERLCVSAKTVQYHVNHLFAKLDVHSRAAAVARAGELGLSGR